MMQYIEPNADSKNRLANVAAAFRGIEVLLERMNDLDGSTDVAYVDVYSACNKCYQMIELYCPPSADRAASVRCLRLARMFMNNFVKNSLVDEGEFAINEAQNLHSGAWYNIRASKFQANASIALAQKD